MGFFTSAIMYFVNLFLGWLGIFASPFTNPEMLWIIIPIYINWIFTDFFQERRKTHIGNAITNGAVVLWVSIDWARRTLSQGMSTDLDFILKSIIIITVSIYGLIIVIQGVRGLDVVTKLGRVRETSYIMLMFSPIIYNIIELNITNIIAIILFFPAFYYLFELINKKLLPEHFGKKEEESKPEIKPTPSPAPKPKIPQRRPRPPHFPSREPFQPKNF